MVIPSISYPSSPLFDLKPWWKNRGERGREVAPVDGHSIKNCLRVTYIELSKMKSCWGDHQLLCKIDSAVDKDCEEEKIFTSIWQDHPWWSAPDARWEDICWVLYVNEPLGKASHQVEQGKVRVRFKVWYGYEEWCESQTESHHWLRDWSHGIENLV